MLKKKIMLTLLAILLAGMPGSVMSSVSERCLIFDGAIVFENGGEKESNIYLLEAKMNKPKRLTSIGNNIEPMWSPNGKNIAFTSIRKGHQAEIYIMDSNGKNQKRVTYTENGFSTSPRWSTDGKKLYFFSNIKGRFEENIIDLGNGKVKTLYSFDKPLTLGEIFQTYLSPDGKYKIAHYTSGKVVLIDEKTKAENNLEYGGKPAWNKDSEKLAYFLGGNSPRNILSIFDLNKNQYVEKIKVSSTNYEECCSPSWSKDSKQMVYTCGPVAGPGEVWLYILDLRTRKFTKLLQGGNPDWY